MEENSLTQVIRERLNNFRAQYANEDLTFREKHHRLIAFFQDFLPWMDEQTRHLTDRSTYFSEIHMLYQVYRSGAKLLRIDHNEAPADIVEQLCPEAAEVCRYLLYRTSSRWARRTLEWNG